MAQVDSENSTIVPVTTRRLFLANVAVALGGTALAVAIRSAPASDPTHELIDAYREAAASHVAALEEQDRFQELNPYRMYEPACLACYAHDDAFWALIKTNPTTFAGAVALLSFLQELTISDAWLFHVDDGGVVIPLIANLARALPKLAVSA